MAENDRLVDARGAVLAIWRRWMAYHRASGADEEPQWGDERNERNPIIDAEMLECLLYPSFAARSAKVGLSLSALDDPAPKYVAGVLGEGDDDTLDLNFLRELFMRLQDYLETWGGTSPDFRPGSYLVEAPNDSAYAGRLEEMRSRAPGIVDAYTFSISLCVHAKYLLSQWRDRSDDRWESLAHKLRVSLVDLERVRFLLDLRLTAALQGLSRSFAVGSATHQDWRAAREARWEETEGLAQIRRRVIRQFGTRDDANPGTPFECGWSWGETEFTDEATKNLLDRAWGDAVEQLGGRAEDLEGVEFKASDWPTPAMTAQRLPYLYFTVTAIDGIADLFSAKVRTSQLLTAEQAGLVSHLGFLWQVSWAYWREIAYQRPTPGGPMAIEEVPWRTVDRNPNIYWTVLVLRIVTAFPEAASISSDEQYVEPLTGVLEEVCRRAGITGAAKISEEQAKLHDTGVVVTLDTNTADEDFRGGWLLLDLTPQVLKVAARLLQGTYDEDVKRRLNVILDAGWRQMGRRLVRPNLDGSADSFAWDEPSGLTGDDDPDPGGAGSSPARVTSWYMTQRMVEALAAIDEARAMRLHRIEAVEVLFRQTVADLRWIILDKLDAPSVRQKRLQELQRAEEVAQRSPALGLALAMDIGKEVSKQLPET